MSGVVPGTDNPRGAMEQAAAKALWESLPEGAPVFVAFMGDENPRRSIRSAIGWESDDDRTRVGCTPWSVRVDEVWVRADLAASPALPEGTGEFEAGRKAGLEEAAGIAAALSRSPMSDEPWRSIRDAARSVAALPEGTGEREPFLVEPGWVRSDFIDQWGGPSYRLLTYPDGVVRFEHRCVDPERGTRITAPRVEDHVIAYNDAGKPTVTPSIDCPDCPTHGFITEGRWHGNS